MVCTDNNYNRNLLGKTAKTKLDFKRSQLLFWSFIQPGSLNRMKLEEGSYRSLLFVVMIKAFLGERQHMQTHTHIHIKHTHIYNIIHTHTQNKHHSCVCMCTHVCMQTNKHTPNTCMHKQIHMTQTHHKYPSHIPTWAYIRHMFDIAHTNHTPNMYAHYTWIHIHTTHYAYNIQHTYMQTPRIPTPIHIQLYAHKTNTQIQNTYTIQSYTHTHIQTI